MIISPTLEKKIQYRIKKSKASVFMLKDFLDLSDRDQIIRALRKLIKKNLIIKTGKGVYVKARISQFSGEIIPVINITEIAKIVAQKTNNTVIPNKYEMWYNEGKSTQIPTGRIVAVVGRINRKIGFNDNFVTYEQVRNTEKYYRRPL